MSDNSKDYTDENHSDFNDWTGDLSDSGNGMEPIEITIDNSFLQVSFEDS